MAERFRLGDCELTVSAVRFGQGRDSAGKPLSLRRRSPRVACRPDKPAKQVGQTTRPPKSSLDREDNTC